MYNRNASHFPHSLCKYILFRGSVSSVLKTVNVEEISYDEALRHTMDSSLIEQYLVMSLSISFLVSYRGSTSLFWLFVEFWLFVSNVLASTRCVPSASFRARGGDDKVN